MKVLIACEESQTVCKAFREKGHEAYSCDILECSGGHPEWHILGDVLPYLNGKTNFKTSDGKEHKIDTKWDIIIAHPPCTYLTVTGNRWLNVEKYGEKAIERKKLQLEAADFFMKFVEADCDKIAIENPVGFISTYYKKPTQIIQPYEYGHPAKKRTCLWLKGLPSLIPTNIVEVENEYVYKNGKKDQLWHVETMHLPKEKRAIARSKTFEGIAKAMAEQWG